MIVRADMHIVIQQRCTDDGYEPEISFVAMKILQKKKYHTEL